MNGSAPSTSSVPPRLRRESVRYWTSVGVSTAVVAATTVVGALVGAPTEPTPAGVVSIYFSAWSIFCLTYAFLTWRVLRRPDAATLERWLQETPKQQRRRHLSQIFLGTGGTTAAISLAIVALGAVVAVALVPALREAPVVVILAVVVVVASWVLLVVVLAVRYASESPRRRGLEFSGPDGQQLVFSDFLYLAVQVVTTFSPSDVAVTSRSMRREMTAHAVVAFAFNAVVVALLVSLLITAAG